MNRLIEYTVFSGLVTAWRFATCPTRRSPVFVMATTEGVVREPSWLGITTGSPPCITATTELVVPRSMPIILLIASYRPLVSSACPTPASTGSTPVARPNGPQKLGGRRSSCTAALVKNSPTIQLECIVVKISDISCKDIFLLDLWQRSQPCQSRLDRSARIARLT